MVCYDHSLRICGICCVDFAYTDLENGDGEEDGDGVDEEENEDEQNEEDERVFVLNGSMGRFVPQWDGQLLGPAKLCGMNIDYKNPPKPLPASSFAKYSCSTCQLTWLIGEEGKEAAKSHPSHHTYQHIYCGTSRSLVVYADGACRSNGKNEARSGIGIFFQEGSRYNISEPHEPLTGGQPTNQSAELYAIARALETVRLRVIPDRLEHIMQAKGSHDPDTVKDVKGFRLIVTTDSSYVVEGMCSYILDWTLQEDKDTFSNKKGKEIKNSDSFLQI